VWDKPASPCLASRIEYGVPVTCERLCMVEAAEGIVAEYFPGKTNIRVRCHKDLARIEVDKENLPALASPPVADKLAARLKELGFSFVALDLAGFRSGSMNMGEGAKKRTS